MNLALIYMKRFFPVKLKCQKISIKKKIPFLRSTKYIIFMDEDKYSLYYLLVMSKLSEEIVIDIIYRNNGCIFEKDKILVFNTEEECNVAIEELRETIFVSAFVEEMFS